MKTISELQTDIRQLRNALKKSADLVTAWIEGMACDAGNFDGGSAASCEHCQFRNFLNNLHDTLRKTTPPEDLIDWYEQAAGATENEQHDQHDQRSHEYEKRSTTRNIQRLYGDALAAPANNEPTQELPF
jgi:hypothetical protein